MKVASSFLAATAMVVALTLAGPADGATVQCIGTESTGWGGPLGQRYCYEVNLAAGDTMTSFNVGDCSGFAIGGCAVVDAAGNAIPGWGPCAPGQPELHCDVKTPHGGISPGPFGSCKGGIVWTGPAIAGVAGPIFLGFNCTLPSHDVGWTLINVAPGVPGKENWQMPVGMGCGPVHGPIPEPMTLSVLALGACLSLLRRRR